MIYHNKKTKISYHKLNDSFEKYCSQPQTSKWKTTLNLNHFQETHGIVDSRTIIQRIDRMSWRQQNGKSKRQSDWHRAKLLNLIARFKNMRKKKNSQRKNPRNYLQMVFQKKKNSSCIRKTWKSVQRVWKANTKLRYDEYVVVF